MRSIPIGKTILLSIITLTIYYHITVYRNTQDIQNARAAPFGAWQVVFWVGIFIPFVGLVNYIMNGIGLGELRAQRNLPASSMWIVALIVSLLIPIVGQVLWAVHYNGTLTETGSGAAAGNASTA